MTFRLFILFLFFLPASAALYAQDDAVIYSYDREEIRSLNANTLADLIRYIPFVSPFYSDAGQQGHIGVYPIDICGIYRDDLPLFMDQNTIFNLHLIGLEQIQRVEIRTAETESFAKNLLMLNIYLYSIPIDEKPASYSFELANTTNNDFLTRANFSLSSKKHSMSVGLNRYYENGLKLDPFSRRFDWASFTLYSANAAYKFQFYDRASLELNYNLNIFDQVSRGNVYPQTSRAEDYINFTSTNWLNAKFKTRLSKTHILKLNSQYNVSTRYRYTKEKDLSSGTTELLPVANDNDSVSYRFNYFLAEFKKSDTSVNYGYALGVEFTSLQDRNYKSIDAIKIGYTDYVLFASAFYKPLKEIELEMGFKYLTNNLSGSYVLPRGELTLVVNPGFFINLKHHQSLIYPKIYQLFYDSRITGTPIENNLQLQGAVFRSTNFQLFLNYDRVQVKSGMFFTSLHGYPAVNFAQNTWNNQRSYQNLATYFALDFETNGLKINPVAVIHGLNSLADTFDQYYFLPELSFKTSWFMEQFDLGIAVFAKFMGTKNILSHSEDGVRVFRTNGYKMLDLSVYKYFIDRKLCIRSGFSNLFNVFQVGQDVFMLSELEQKYLYTEQAFIGRGRNYFIRMTLDL